MINGQEKEFIEIYKKFKRENQKTIVEIVEFRAYLDANAIKINIHDFIQTLKKTGEELKKQLNEKEKEMRTTKVDINKVVKFSGLDLQQNLIYSLSQYTDISAYESVQGDYIDGNIHVTNIETLEQIKEELKTKVDDNSILYDVIYKIDMWVKNITEMLKKEHLEKQKAKKEKENESDIIK